MEQISITEELSKLTELYQSLVAKVTSEAVAVALLQEMGKNLRVRLMAGRESKQENGYFARADSLATSRQLGKLRFLRVQIPEGLTKRRASELIDEAVAKLNR